MSRLTTPPLPPKIIRELSALEINSIEDLHAADVCAVFLQLKAAGLSVTESLFWKLVALCEGTDAWLLNEAEKAQWRKRLAATPPQAVFPITEQMQGFMQAALDQAQMAADMGEVPVGAVVVYRDEIIASAYNRCVSDCNISHHAEIQALAAAGQILGNYRLGECDLYVSLEPCSMCAGAIIQARIKRLIYAAAEPRTGAVGSVLNLFAIRDLNSHTAVKSGVLAAQSSRLLQDFFKNKR